MDPEDSIAVGPKAATLARLLKADLPVPPGFVVTEAVFQRFMETADPTASITAALEQCEVNSASEIEALCKRICKRLEGSKIPIDVGNSIQRALAAWPEIRLWAVRSSAMAEDSSQASFAGQHDSFLNVPTHEVLEYVRRCWISLFGPRAWLYRIRNGIRPPGAAMAVIVQQMVPSELAGVLFTADPNSGDTNRIIVEGAPGHGDRVVSGQVTPDRFVLEKTTLKVLDRTTGLSLEAVPEMPRAHEKCNGLREGRQRRLDDATVSRLGGIGQRVERILAVPVDIEWAVSRNEIYLLQARPITRKKKCWEDRQVWTNLNTGEGFPDVTTPMTWSILRTFLAPVFHSIFRLHGAELGTSVVVGLVAGRIYFNINTGLAALKPFSFLLDKTPNLARALGGGEVEQHRQTLRNIPDSDLPDLGFHWWNYLCSLPGLLRLIMTHLPGRAEAWTVRLEARVHALTLVDIDVKSTSELVEFFTQVLHDGFEGWDLLYLGTQAAALPVFQKACRDWLDDPNLTLGYRLFAGLGGLPETKATLTLWRLAIMAASQPDIRATVCSNDCWTQVRIRLEQIQPGCQFLTTWNSFMAEHGHHCRGELELINARWSETPDYILGLVRGYVQSIGRSDPVESQRRLAEKRRQLTQQCVQKLRNPIKRWIFSKSLRRAQRLAVNREEWKNLAVRQFTILRRILLTLGQRLHQAGVLSEAHDVFFLEWTEIARVASGTPGLDVAARVRSRRNEYETNLFGQPPPVVVGRFVPTSIQALRPASGVTVLEGIPVSPGKTIGPAKVILRTDDDQQVLPGEILVARVTDPAWTPYFINAAGIVTDQGGVLSHGSIIAREYGLPAVTNTGAASCVIRTGDLLEVDGDRGLVTIMRRVERAELERKLRSS